MDEVTGSNLGSSLYFIRSHPERSGVRHEKRRKCMKGARNEERGRARERQIKIEEPAGVS